MTERVHDCYLNLYAISQINIIINLLISRVKEMKSMLQKVRFCVTHKHVLLAILNLYYILYYL